MENSLKQRIIGAVVLVALAIIFLPAILKEKASNGTFESKIPEKPQELEEYRVDADRIEKLKKAKDAQQQQSIANNTLADKQGSNKLKKEQDENEELAEPNKLAEQSSDTPVERTARKSKSKSAQLTESSSTKVADTRLQQGKPESEQTTPAETLSSDFKSAAWVVQVASFSNESNAINLVEKLKKNQFKAYRRKSLADGKTVYRVYVGPFIDKPKAQSKTAAISKVSETKVVLRVFDPVKH